MTDYKDLSRRALIKLNKDFDAENNDALILYLQKHQDQYEKIRFSEKIIDTGDNIYEKASTTCSNFLDNILNNFSDAADSILTIIK